MMRLVKMWSSCLREVIWAPYFEDPRYTHYNIIHQIGAHRTDPPESEQGPITSANGKVLRSRVFQMFSLAAHLSPQWKDARPFACGGSHLPADVQPQAQRYAQMLEIHAAFVRTYRT